MKEIYAWAPWFEELGRKIDEGGEQYLIDQAKEVRKQVNWGEEKGKEPALLN